MHHHTPVWILYVLVSLILVSSCSVFGAPSSAAVVDNIVFTQAAQTVVAQLTPPPSTLTAMATRPPATVTPYVGVYVTRSPTAPATPTQTLEPMKAPVLVRANVQIDCRAGPSAAFDIVGSLIAGESVSLLGRSDPAGWWYIPNPLQRRKKLVDYCWVYSGSVSLSGDASAAPVVSSPPTPTVAP